MVGHIVVGYFFDTSEDVDVEVVYSLCCSCEGGVESSSHSLPLQSSMPQWADDNSIGYY